jgi:hypothetical protein
MRFVEDGGVVVLLAWGFFAFFWWKYKQRRKHPDALQHIKELEESNQIYEEYVEKITSKKEVS